MSERVAISPDTVDAPWRLAGYPKETPVLLALSGGADSRALLHLLAAQAKRDGFILYAAHVNHGIRGADADRDALFCKMLARDYGCELFELAADVVRLAAENGRSTETEAREVRYAFFAQIMRERQIPILVTAHHADDLLETVLFRLARGTGLTGLCGIAPVRAFENGMAVRPFLPFTRREIRAYCESEQLTFVEDETNGEPICARNRIRLEVVPVLEAVAGEPQKSVWRMTTALAQDKDYLALATRDFLNRNRTERGISLPALREAHPAIRARVWDALSPTPLEAVHREALESLVACGRSGSQCALPNRFVACVQSGFLTVLPDLRRRAEELPASFGTQPLTLCDGKLIVFVTKKENSEEIRNVHNLSTHTCIIIERAYLPIADLEWRSRRSGDTFQAKGRVRRLADMYREKNVPPMLRDALPVLCRGKEILWAPFVGEAERDTQKEAEACFIIEMHLLAGTEKKGDDYV